MKIAEPLTDKRIKAAKPGDKPLYDGGGLILVVTKTGAKIWRFKYSMAGRDNRMSLGKYPDISLKEARERRAELRKLVEAGIDPVMERKNARERDKSARAEAANTFTKVANEWWSRNKARWKANYADAIQRRLAKHVFPLIGDIPMARLERLDYVNVIRAVEDKETLEISRRIAQIIGQVTGYALDAGILAHDAGARLARLARTSGVKHHAAITRPEELGLLLADIDQYPGEPAISHALRVMPYVFVRSSELRGAKWRELDLDAGQWLIPAERMKMKRPHVVPLAPQAVKLFQSMRDYSGAYDLVFPSAMSSTRCISDVGLLNALRRMGYGKDKMTIHGFRTSASTILNEQGYNRDWIEAQLAHAEKNAIRDAYNRADYLTERRKMMFEWADYLDSLRAAANSLAGNNK